MGTHLLSTKKTKEILDTEIIEGLKNNKEDLGFFQTLFYKRYAGYVYKILTDKCCNFREPEQLAKDVLQETFSKVFSAIHKFSFPAKAPIEDHGYIIKGWIGKFADKCFKQVYEKRIKETSIEISYRSRDETICPMCGEFLVEEKNTVVCPNNDYKAKKEVVHGSPLPEDRSSFDLFESLYQTDDNVIDNEFRKKLILAMSQLNEKQKHIILAYADEGCLYSKQHISKKSLEDLCSAYDTLPDTIKHIKNRALKKMKDILFSDQ